MNNSHREWSYERGHVTGGIQIQYTFPFDNAVPVGTESKRRIDAFYKSGDAYKHVVTRVSISNIQIKTSAFFGPLGLALTLPTKLPGDWTLGTVRLATLSEGKFRNIGIEPESSSATDTDARIVWNGARVASEFGYSSSEEAVLKLVTNKTAWVSAEYKGQNAGDTLTVVKPLGLGNKP